MIIYFKSQISIFNPLCLIWTSLTCQVAYAFATKTLFCTRYTGPPDHIETVGICTNQFLEKIVYQTNIRSKSFFLENTLQTWEEKDVPSRLHYLNAVFCRLIIFRKSLLCTISTKNFERKSSIFYEMVIKRDFWNLRLKAEGSSKPGAVI